MAGVESGGTAGRKANVKKETIYLAMACTIYEGSYPIKAFEIETDAIKFVLKCEAYHFKMPKYPDTDIDSPGGEEIYDSFCEKKERWVSRHPAGRDNTSCDSFMVIPIPKVANVELSGRVNDL